MRFVKKFYEEKQHKNVTFISDPAHSKRISLFFEYLTGINGDFKYKVVEQKIKLG